MNRHTWTRLTAAALMFAAASAAVAQSKDAVPPSSPSSSARSLPSLPLPTESNPEAIVRRMDDLLRASGDLARYAYLVTDTAIHIRLDPRDLCSEQPTPTREGEAIDPKALARIEKVQRLVNAAYLKHKPIPIVMDDYKCVDHPRQQRKPKPRPKVNPTR